MKNIKNKYQAILTFGLILVCLLGGSVSGYSQNIRVFEDDGCGNVKWSNQNPYGASDSGIFNLQVKEKILQVPPKKLSIDAGKQGGVRIKGWERNEVYIKACVQAHGKDETEARTRVSEVRLENSGDVIRAISPTATNDDYFFKASYDIRVPFNTDLTIKTNDGGLNISGVRGSILFDLNNGGAIFNNIAGDLRGQTVWGNLTFNLTGEKWEGGGVDTRTINGSVLIKIPENYSARLETGTKRGNFQVNFPVDKTRENKFELNLDLGTGGAIIKTLTANGQISIQRQSAAKESKK